MGTVAYMAPEQALDTKHADARADIYSLGVTLWYLLTGRPLFDGETTVEKLMAHQTKPVPSLRSACPAVSPALEEVFTKMAAKSPEARYQTMTEVIADLERCRSGTAAGAPAVSAAAEEGAKLEEFPQGIVAPRPPWWRDRKKQLAAGAGGLLFVLLGVWVIVRDKGGREVARIAVPAGGSATVETATDGGDAKRSPWKLPAGAPPPAMAPFDAAKANEHQAAWAKYLALPIELTNSIGMKFMLIPPGEFDMGSTAAEVTKLVEEAQATKQSGWYIERLPYEAPQHRVRITQPFYLGQCEVTQAEYERIVGSNPSQFKDDPTHPVETVKWDEASAFGRKLGELPAEQAVHAQYRLPTEAEWEYACRAGTTTTWYAGDDEGALKEHAWFVANAGKKLHPVGQKSPNAWGLYDMDGNVWEWCQDWFGDRYYATSPVDDPTGAPEGSHRVNRGGSWSAGAAGCRSAYRGGASPGGRSGNLGFRLARTVYSSSLSR